MSSTTLALIWALVFAVVPARAQDAAPPADGSAPAPAASPAEPPAPRPLDRLSLFKNQGAPTLDGSPLPAFASLVCGGSLKVDAQSMVSIVPDRFNFLMFTGFADGETGKLTASTIQTPTVSLLLESGVLIYALNPSTGMPNGCSVTVGDATVTLTRGRGLVKVEKGALTVVVGEGQAQVKAGGDPVTLGRGQSVTRPAGAALQPAVYAFWPEILDHVGLSPQAADLLTRRIGSPFAPSRNFVLLVLVGFVLFLVRGIYPKSGDVACILAIAFVFLEAMFGLTHVWVDLKFATVPLGAFAGSLLIAAWGWAEATHKNVRRAGGQAFATHVLRYTGLLAVGVLMLKGVLAFSATGSQSVMELDRTLVSFFTNPMVSRLPPNPNAFAYEFVSAAAAAALAMVLRGK